MMKKMAVISVSTGIEKWASYSVKSWYPTAVLMSKTIHASIKIPDNAVITPKYILQSFGKRKVRVWVESMSRVGGIRMTDRYIIARVKDFTAEFAKNAENRSRESVDEYLQSAIYNQKSPCPRVSVVISCLTG